MRINIVQKFIDLIRGKKKSHSNEIESLKNQLQQITKKLSMVNNIYRFDDILFYVPNYPIDHIQETIVDTNNFYVIEDLIKIDKYLEDNAIILDIGANIGNHSIYWAKKNTQRIYSFEPVKETFEILKKNIEINNCSKKVILYNIGLGDEETSAKIKEYSQSNTGGTVIEKESSEFGTLKINTLDNLNIDCEKINFIKIDTEGFEYKVLMGGIKTIKKHRPNIYVEVSNDNAEKVERFFTDLEYKNVYSNDYTDKLYIPNEKYYTN